MLMTVVDQGVLLNSDWQGVFFVVISVFFVGPKTSTHFYAIFQPEVLPKEQQT